MNTPMPQETFASLLRTFRQGHSWSQGALADAAGYDRSYISYLERGMRNPTRDVVIKLGEVLDLTPLERDALLLSAHFAAESPATAVNLNDRLVELIAQSISDLSEPQRSQFRDELAEFIRYLRFRFSIDTPDELRHIKQRRRVGIV